MVAHPTPTDLADRLTKLAAIVRGVQAGNYDKLDGADCSRLSRVTAELATLAEEARHETD